jgi:hypothetical protein
MERKKHARRLIRAASVRAAGNAGTGPLLMFHMPNTNDYLNPTNSVRFQEKNKNKNKQATSKQLASRQTSKHRRPRTTSNGRASKTLP